MYSTLIDILGEQHYCMLPSVFQGMSSQIRANIDFHTPVSVVKEDRLQALIPFRNGQIGLDTFSTEVFMGNAERMKRWGELEDDDQVINVVRLTGVMTRYGGDCSYGSADLRDMMMRSADVKQTISHIIYCQTPGGMASALLDFRMAIDYAHSKGQKVYMFCDGYVASGGAFLSAMCDGVYYFNGDDMIGSLGLYSAFFTLPDGAKNTITSETYHERYASRSTKKNEAVRAASEGDMSIIDKEANEYLEYLLTNLKADRPKIKEDQMEGAMYKMKDVVGTLVDGQSTMTDLATMIYNDWMTDCKKKKASTGTATKQNSNTKNTIEMNKQYVQVAAFIGEQPYESDKDNCLTLQEAQADALEEKLGTINATSEQLATENTELKQQVETLTASETSLKAENGTLAQQVAELTEKLNTATQENEQLKSSSDTATQTIAGLQAEVKTQKDGKEAAEAIVATQKLTIEENAQTITDLNTKIESLNNGSGESLHLGEGLKNNGAQAAAPALEQAPAYDPSLSATENAKIQNDYLAKLQKRAYAAQK